MHQNNVEEEKGIRNWTLSQSNVCLVSVSELNVSIVIQSI